MLVSEGDIAVDDRFGRESGRIYVTGIQALARLPVDSRRADLRANFNTAGFISGYEGSPLAGYDLELGRQSDLLEAHDIVFRPAVNEELAATSVQGTQLASASSRPESSESLGHTQDSSRPIPMMIGKSRLGR